MSDLREAAKLALIALENGTSPNLWLSTKENLRKALVMEKFIEVNQEIEEALKQPKREWVGLTQDDKNELFNNWWNKNQSFNKLIEDTEEKLMEKNNG